MFGLGFHTSFYNDFNFLHAVKEVKNEGVRGGGGRGRGRGGGEFSRELLKNDSSYGWTFCAIQGIRGRRR